MNPCHAFKSDHLMMVESLGVSAGYDRPAAISTVRTGWNFTLGSGVT
jgi:hypothetical protein